MASEGTESEPSQSERQALLARIRHLEEQNSLLQDKLDMIYAILAPDYEEPDVTEDAAESGLVQIQDLNPPKSR